MTVYCKIEFLHRINEVPYNGLRRSHAHDVWAMKSSRENVVALSPWSASMLTFRLWVVFLFSCGSVMLNGCGSGAAPSAAREKTVVRCAQTQPATAPLAEYKADPRLTPPVAKVIPKEVNLGGQRVVDNYWWLRDKSDPAVIAYLNAENAYTDAAMKPAEGLQKKLYDEMTNRLPDKNETVPYRVDNWWYSSRHDEDYPIYVRRLGSPKADPVVIADVNELAKGHKFFDYVLGPVSDDGNLLLFATDVTGNRQYELQVKDLRTGKVLPEKIAVVDSFAWMTDNKTFYYVKEDDAKRDYRLYRHTLGMPVANDPLLYEEKDPQFSITLTRTRDKKFFIVSSESSTTSEERVIPADHMGDTVLVEPRRADMEYYLDHRDGRFYIRVNDTSENFRIVTAPDNNPGCQNWKELVGARPDVVIGDEDVFAHDLIVSERRDGITQLAVAKLPEVRGDPAARGDAMPVEIRFNEPDFVVSLGDNAEFDPSFVRIVYASLTTPQRVIDVDLTSGQQTLKKQEAVEGDFKAKNYREERVFATACDGTKIPISLVYRVGRNGARPSGPRPMLLDGYGSYGNSEDVNFSSDRLSLLDRGMIYAIAHVRGGGEYGRNWYNGARIKTKQNTFGDFIACAEYLEKTGYTAPNKLAIYGASAGGLLIGAVVNQRPDLFRAAVAEVPWVDVLADMSDPSIPLTTLEYSEWGNPNKPAERALIAAYDPYTNVRPQAYPAMLVRESLNDSQVQYWDAARWVAKLRAAKKQAGPAGKSELLFKMDMNAGHDGASGQDAQLQDDAFDDAWILTRLGVE
jgi:oligopeptidase B